MATGAQDQDVTHPPPSETSPLLGDRATAENGVSSGESEANVTDLPLIEEASFGELLTILMSTWVGVFFAALGMSPLWIISLLKKGVIKDLRTN